MANNKVQLANGTVLMDISDTTAVASNVEQGKYFYLANGVKVEGTGLGSIIGGEDYLGKLLNNTLSNYENSDITKITTHAFRSAAVKNLSFPNVTSITAPFCYRATSLESISLPKLTVISTANCFDGCSKLRTIALSPNFSGFSGATACFNGCPLTDYTPFRKITSVSQSVFSGTKFKTVVSPKLSAPGNGAFSNITTLEAADFTAMKTTNATLFSGCSMLSVIVLRRATAITALGNINSLNNTPFASGKAGGTLYVPSALVSNYQSATNWSTILGYGNGTQNQILPIEGSIYETQYADGTPIE